MQRQQLHQCNTSTLAVA